MNLPGIFIMYTVIILLWRCTMKNITRITTAALILSLMICAMAGCKVEDVIKNGNTDGSAAGSDGGDGGKWVVPDVDPSNTIETLPPVVERDDYEPDEPDFDDEDDGDDVNVTEATTAKKTLGKVTVTNAYKKKIKTRFIGTVTSRIPKVKIEGVDTSKVNKEMKSKVQKAAKKNKVDYTYYVGKKYVSIFISVQYDEDWEESDHYIYNISRETGKKLDRKGMLKAYGISSSKFNSRAKKAIIKYWKDAKWTKDYKSMYNKAISSKTLNSAIPYVNKKGKLCYFVKGMEIPAGGGVYDNYGPC